MSMEQFMIRAKANEGRKVFLADPATGLMTDEWIIVRNRWCDEFQRAKAKAFQDAIAEARDGDDAEGRTMRLVASLVGGWSFEQECTAENVINFLTAAPQIVDQIDRLATKDGFFFNNSVTDS